MGKKFASAGKLLGRPPHKVRRSIQQDNYSCGAHVCLTALRLFRRTKIPTANRLMVLLGTTKRYGTEDAAIITYLRMRGLTVSESRRMRWTDLKIAVSRKKVVVATVDDDHYALVHGIDDEYVYLSDPAVGRCAGRAQTIREFQSRFSKAGFAIGT